MSAFYRIAVLLGAVLAVVLAPPIFESLFAMESLLGREQIALGLAAVMLAASTSLLYRAGPSAKLLSFLIFNIGLLVVGELAVRVGVKLVAPGRQPALAALSEATYADRQAYVGHPFIQFTGRPFAVPRGEPLPAGIPAFNDLGFPSRSVERAKPPGIVRVAALGGSTTASGYPQLLEGYLNGAAGDQAAGFEVLNFGLGFYTSAHSLVNFVLNVVDFAPDYVVVHHAWNDEKARRAVSGFRTDYSHALKSFDASGFALERYLMRVSVVYRLLRRVPPPWVFVENAAVVRRVKTASYDNPAELVPFRRNIETILDVAAARGMTVVLTTMPRSTDPAKRHSHGASHIDQCNDVLREIAKERRSRDDEVLFVDLDRSMTGQMEEVFLDVGHVDERGRRYKAERIGEAILTDVARRHAHDPSGHDRR